ncbi:MAG: U32 family peptidase [Clostridiales bacterium]|jgi:putative protease|nr:U32 family peptidase [Clostridiales bacterium]
MEICAPAGNVQALKAAVAGGADAVYLGIDRFNLRVKAENFTAESLKEHIDYAHLFGVKAYLAFNSCIKQSEYGGASELIRETSRAAPDAYIVTDWSLIDKIKAYAPGSAAHLSTQVGIHNKYGARAAEDAGADRIILSRETDLNNIRVIRENTSLEIEVFAHGALCVGFSGACLLSALRTGKSGNRGHCLQLCRLPYYKGGKRGYYLSAKDLCLLDNLRLLEGVDALKIEGRLKRPEYAAECALKYGRAIDGFPVLESDVADLKKIYNRGGFCEGYLFGGDVIESKTANHIGLFCGTVSDAAAKNGEAYSQITIVSEYPIGKGDGYKILRNGYEVCGGEICGAEGVNAVQVDGIKKRRENGEGGDGACGVKETDGRRLKSVYALTVRKNYDIKKGDSFCITSDLKRLAELNALTKKLPLKFSLTLKAGEFAALTASCGEIEYAVRGIPAEKAENRPSERGILLEKLAKINEKEDAFRIADAEIDCGADVFYPMSALNNLKRAAVAGLKARLLDEYAKSRKAALLKKRAANGTASVCGNKNGDGSGAGEIISACENKKSGANCAEKARLVCENKNENERFRKNLNCGENCAENNTDNKKIIAEIQSKEQLSETVGKCHAVVFAPRVYSERITADFFKRGLELGLSVKNYLKLPLQADENDLRVLEKILNTAAAPISETAGGKPYAETAPFAGLAGDNPYALFLSKKYGLDYFAGLFHNVYNAEIMSALRKQSPSAEFLLSAELNRKEIAEINRPDAYVFAFGRLPLMSFKHCVKKTFGLDCGGCDGRERLADGKYEYEILRTKIYNCYYTLYNPLLINLSRYDIAGNLYINASDFKKKDTAEVIEAFLSGTEYKPKNVSFTSGHYKRGVL